jgi:hypothetical protein
MLPKNLSVRVTSQKGRENFTWSGGAHLSTLSSFQVTKRQDLKIVL